MEDSTTKTSPRLRHVYSKDDISLETTKKKEKQNLMSSVVDGRKNPRNINYLDISDTKSESGKDEENRSLEPEDFESIGTTESETENVSSSIEQNSKPLRKLTIPDCAVIKTVDSSTNTEKIKLDADFLEKNQHTPLIVFINPKSGGLQGKKLTKELENILNPVQIFDLTNGGPTPGLELIRNVKNAKILVCGGDGTAGWVLMYLDKLNMNPVPPVAILPLGTGNDLSRAFKWGGGYSGEKLAPILASIEFADQLYLDRWSLNIAMKKKEESEKLEFTQKTVMNNYFSVGVDAQVALEFHRQREAHPEKFKSRFGNKVSYTTIGSKAMFKKTPINKLVTLEVDGKIIEISNDIEGLVILNLNSYMGGTNLWGNSTSSSNNYKTHSTDDKLLEIVAVGGSFHIGAIKAKLASAKRIAQGSDVKFNLINPTCMQVDGEPWIQEPGIVHISFLNKGILLKKANKIVPVIRPASTSTAQSSTSNSNGLGNSNGNSNARLSPAEIELLKQIVVTDAAISIIEQKTKINAEHIISNNIKPLIIMINRKSGGQQGLKTLKLFKEILGPHQVFELCDGGPEPAFEMYKDVLDRIRILVCGGDGTVGWVLMTIDKLNLKIIPPLGVLPLGTGNDLARSLKWGGGYGGEKLIPIIKSVHFSEEILSDRWKLSIGKEDKPTELSLKTVMNNYFSVGVDAQVALEFHKQREAHPEKFKSRFGNKVSYTTIGSKTMFKKSALHKSVTLEVDGKVIDIPSDIEGLVVLNLSSYMGGANLWGNKNDNKFKSQSVSDGLLEVVGVNGSFHLGAIKANLSSGRRIAQGSEIKFKFKESIPVQVDGEPWIENNGIAVIQFLNKGKLLKKLMIPTTTSSENSKPSLLLQEKP